MELVQSSAEHHFLVTLEGLKNNSSDWVCMYFSLSKMLKHESLVSDPSKIGQKIKKAWTQTDKFVAELYDKFDESFEGSISVFSDMDVFVLVKTQDKMQNVRAKEIFKLTSGTLPKAFSEMNALSAQFQFYMKLADQKLLSEKKRKAYDDMADTKKVASIGARRNRRDEPLVMMVEDDRFTAHYASTILQGTFDLIVCKNGEEAISSYIENAPDIVFLDIHLPGLTGHEVLQAINGVDPESFVVMLSVDSVQDNIVKASEMGARKFLKKPFTKERLIETVKSSPYVRKLIRSDRAGSENLLH